MIITRNDTAEPRGSQFLNAGIRPDSWVGWSHVQNYEQPLLPHSWKDRLTWNGLDSLGSIGFPPAYQHTQTSGMCSLPAAEPLHLSMYWKALMTPFSPRLYTHFPFMTGLGKMVYAVCSTVALKRDSCDAWEHLQNMATSLNPRGPIPVGALAALPQKSPETQKSIQEEQRRWLRGSLLLAQAKALGFLKGHNACCYWESQEAATICVLQEKCPEIFFSAAESLELFCSSQVHQCPAHLLLTQRAACP